MSENLSQLGFDKLLLRNNLPVSDAALTPDSTELTIKAIVDGSLESQNFLTGENGYFFGADTFELNGGGTINGSLLVTGTVTASALNFTPVDSTNIIASINASSEGLTIDADNIAISGATTFDSGYDPSSKLEAVGGSYDTAASGARVRIFPDANTGIQAIDNGGNDVFKVLVGGTDVGDVIFGDSGSNYLKWDKSAGTLTLNGSNLTSAQISSIASGSEPSIQGWTHDIVFSASDADTVAWASGTITLTDGTSYSITGSNTGNMAARTYIYLDKNVSTTALQTTTTASTAVGAGKILIAVAENGTGEATFQTFGGNGGLKVDGSDLVSNSITTNELAANSVTANEINVSNLAAINADLGSITAGNITLDSSGYVKGGQTAYDTGTGFWLGYDSSAYKFSIGDSNDANKKLLWNGTDLIVNGTKLSMNDVFGDGSDGSAIISSNTSLSSDMFYENLTINTGVTLNPNGYRIFVRGTLTTTGTGKIASNGNDGNPGVNATAGTGGAAAYSSGSLPIPLAGGNGGNGGTTFGASGSAGTAGTNQARSLMDNDAAAGGDGGTDGSSGGTGGAAGTNTVSIANKPRIFLSAYNLFEIVSGTVQVFSVSPSSGGGGGGGTPDNADGGGGGGAGSSGGCVFIAFANGSGTINIEAIGGNGGNGGNGAAGAGGGGGGGNGGSILVIYKDATLNTNVSAGTGGTAGSGTDPSNGGNGNDGIVYEIQV